MKQVVQDLSSGATELIDVPCPHISARQLLVRTSRSLISSGTERMLVEFGKASLFDKALQQPDKVRMVLKKIGTDGLISTIDAVRSKLNQPLPLGYCNVGVVAEVGSDAGVFKPGDRVVSNGPHAEMIKAPRNLCARIPDGVDDESAAFTVVASIGLQGIRLAQPSLGETFAVSGVGLIGLLTVQLLHAHGCRVLAIDIDANKLALAKSLGAEVCNPGKGEDPVAAGMAFTRGQGVDGVIVCASTKSNGPVTEGARMCRKRGRIVLVGVTGLELNRADFYEKELTFQVSCSYGPGRYDPDYEEKGQDYPYGLVRWTEQRNFEAVLNLMAARRLDVRSLVSHRFAFDDALLGYKVLIEDSTALGILLEYAGDRSDLASREVVLDAAAAFEPSRPVLGFIGAGNYASRVLIPAFMQADAQLHTIANEGGVNGVVYGRKAGFAVASTDVDAMMADPRLNTVTIVTRHDSHARLAAQALRAGKHVFVEKPLAITAGDLELVREAYDAAHRQGKGPHLMVGYNRRFAPQIVRMKSLLESVREPKTFVMTMNAGAIPPGHWTQLAGVGGGRIIGEACHYIDLMRFLAGSTVVSVQARRMGDGPGVSVTDDKAAILLGFADGSFGTIHYLANGAASFPKERVEVFTAGRVLQLDNFRRLTGYGWPGFGKMNLWRQDKGQASCVQAFVDAVSTGGNTPIAVDEVFEVARITIEVAELLRRQ